MPIILPRAPYNRLLQGFVRRALHVLVKSGGWNHAWLGHSRIPAPVGLAASLCKSPMLSAMLDGLNVVDTQLILHTFLENGNIPVLRQPSASLTRLERCLDNWDKPLWFAGRTCRPDLRPSNSPATFSVVIPFARHLEFFRRCLKSLAPLWDGKYRNRFEIVIVNDDPSYTLEDLNRQVPPRLRPAVRIVSNESRSGIAATLNRAIELSRHEWILFVDCDDLLEKHALRRLEAYIDKYPQARYISSAMVDIDDEDNVLRYRKRVEAPHTLLENGMIAGHLKCVRRDVFDELGLLDTEFDGCQDYDLALKVSFVEPILFIPEYLYRYRWHLKTQSVSQVSRQAKTAQALVRIYRLAALLEQQLSRDEFDFSLVFEGEHAVQWAERFRKYKNPWETTRITICCGDLQPTDFNVRLLMVDLGRSIVGRGRGTGCFDIAIKRAATV